MKKNNKGFTLIEVLAVIILISVIGVVTMPSLTSINQSSQSRIDRSTKLLIENAAKIYVSNYKDEVDKKLSTNSYYCIAVGKLKAYDFLNINNDEINISDFNNTCIKVKKTTVSGKAKYSYDYNSSYKVSSSEDYIPPVISVRDVGSLNSCSPEMTVSSYDSFKMRCRVIARDNKDETKTLSPVDIKENAKQNLNIITLTYETEDTAGNKAKPLKVILKIEP